MNGHPRTVHDEIDGDLTDVLEAAGLRRYGGLTTDDYVRLGIVEFMARYYEEIGLKPGGDAPADAYDDPDIIWTWRP